MNTSRVFAIMASAAVSTLALVAPAQATTPSSDCIYVLQEQGKNTYKAVEECGEAAELSIASKSQLMTWYEHANFNRDQGGRSTPVYGYAGTCDSEGYTLEVTSVWSVILSSYRVYDGCNTSSYMAADGDWVWGVRGHVASIGGKWNDGVWRIKVWHE